MSDHPILLAAGGTGGHLFPAEALAHVLLARGYKVELVTDSRAQKFGQNFPARAVHAVSAATPTGGSMMARAKAVATLGRCTLSALALLRRINPCVVVGFGGYPTVPPLFAATVAHMPTLLHEQNAVMGRANRMLAGRVNKIATGFPLVRVDAKILAKSVLTGNPLRPSVLEAAQAPYPDFDDGCLHLLVTGGSQGARVMSDVVPAAFALLAPEIRAKIVLTQQARGEDRERVIAAYAKLGYRGEVEPFFKDLPKRIADAHLVIARSGASTVAELAAIGRPAILVPFPFALDADQAANAAELARTGAVDVVAQEDFSPESLAAQISAALNDPENLTKRAADAKSAGILDAAERLADQVVSLIPGAARNDRL